MIFEWGWNYGLSIMFKSEFEGYVLKISFEDRFR
jgi:hypothetical protein